MTPISAATKKHGQRGATLIETILATAIAAVMAATAAPGFSHLLGQQRLSTATNELLAAVHLARNEASARGERVVLAPLSGTRWEAGWRLFVDRDDDGRQDADEPTVRSFGPAPAGLTIRAQFGIFAGQVLSFDPDGGVRRPGTNGLVLGRLVLASPVGARSVCVAAMRIRAVQGESCY